MSHRRFEMFHYRQVLVRMRQGDSEEKRQAKNSAWLGRCVRR